MELRAECNARWSRSSFKFGTFRLLHCYACDSFLSFSPSLNHQFSCCVYWLDLIRGVFDSLKFRQGIRILKETSQNGRNMLFIWLDLIELASELDLIQFKSIQNLKEKKKWFWLPSACWIHLVATNINLITNWRESNGGILEDGFQFWSSMITSPLELF